MIYKEDRPDLECSPLAKEIYGFLFWLVIKNQCFQVSFDTENLMARMQVKFDIPKYDHWILSSDDMRAAINELTSIEAIYGTEERIKNKNGDTRTLFYIKDPRPEGYDY